MVAESEDEEMEELELPPPVLPFSSISFKMNKSPLLFFGEMTKRFTPVGDKPKANRGAKVQLDEALIKIKGLESQLNTANHTIAGHDAELQRRVEEISKDMQEQSYKHKSQRKADVTRLSQQQEETERLRVNKDELKAANARIHELKVSLAKETKAKDVAEAAKEVAEAALARQYKIANDLRDDVNASVHRDEYQSKVDELEVAEADARAREWELSELNDNLEETTERLEETTERLAAAKAGPGSGRFAEANAKDYLAAMKKAVGVPKEYTSVPAVEPPSTSSGAKWRKLSVRHVSTVLKGRGEGDDIDLISEALERNGYLQRLATTKLFQPYAKGIARAAISSTQNHWSALHAVHVWDQLELSLRQMRTLGHLLSDVYHPGVDKYAPIIAWQNPFNAKDYLRVPRLASEHARERCYETIANEMGIVVGDDGRCERDAMKLASQMYTKYFKALRKEYSPERPAQPVLFLDGTGGSLGKGICHGEIGCADFMKIGDSDTKQSRATLQPLFLYQVLPFHPLSFSPSPLATHPGLISLLSCVAGLRAMTTRRRSAPT